MKLTELWASTEIPPTVSFEVYPAKSEKAAEKLTLTIETLAGLKPDFFSVTFGAGGSTREGSRELIQTLLTEFDQAVLAYFACVGLGPNQILEILDDYRGLGVQSILAVRGDRPENEGFQAHPQSFAHATDLVSFIQPRYEFCLGVAGYPEGHVEALSRESDLEYLQRKIDLGAEFVITNYFYDNRYYFDFLDRCRTQRIEVPILPGIMPVYSIKMMEMLAGLCGATITKELREGLENLPEDDSKALIEFGIDFALAQCEGLLDAGVPGVHIYTMDRSQSSVRLINQLRASGRLPKRSP